MPYKSREQLRAYQAAWRARRRADYLRGRTCSDCGAATGLHLHHVDPSAKVSHRIWSWAAERRAAELAKCVPLCQSCHQLRHASPPEHGTAARYNSRRFPCRCEECREAKRVRRQRQRTQRCERTNLEGDGYGRN